MNTELVRRKITDGEAMPYGARISFQVLTPHSIGSIGNIPIHLNTGHIATIADAKSTSWGPGRKYTVKLVGFATATEAERSGLQFAQTLLLTAISLNFSLRLIYKYSFPVEVFERFKSEGISREAEGYGGFPAEVVLRQITDNFDVDLLDYSIRLSMELFCSGQIEQNPRSQFVMVVSALEPLCESYSLGSAVSSFVDECEQLLTANTSIDRDLHISLRDRVKGLKCQSIRQSIRNVSEKYFHDDRETWKILDRAYNLRSKLLHEGYVAGTSPNMSEECIVVANVLRKIYEKASGKELHAKPA